MAEGEPDSGVSGDNPDLGRLFELMIRGQAAQQRALDDMRDAAQRQLHMAQTFMTSPGAAQQAQQARQNMSGARAGQTVSSNMPGGPMWTVGANGVVTPPTQSSQNMPGGPMWTPPGAPTGGTTRVISGTVIPPMPTQPPGPPAGAPTTAGAPSAAPQGPAGPPAGGTTLRSLIQQHTTMPTTAADWGTSFSDMAATTAKQVGRSLSRAGLGVWSPYYRNGGGGQGGGGGGGGGNGGGGGGGGQMGPGPYGMGPQGLPPNPVYFGGPGNPLGPYGPYGIYGPAGPNAGGGGGGASPGGYGGGNNGGGGGHGGGGGIMGWLGGHIPGAGIVKSIFGEVRNQRAKNEYYQNIEGGSNAAGFGERMHEEAYAFTTGGVLSGDEARTAFKGVTRLGYNGRVDDEFSGQGGRQNALDFIYHAKTSYGASVNESLKNLEVVSKNSTLSLAGLNKALKDISDTAGKAGVNAQMARAQYMALLQTGMAAGYGAGAIQTAQNIQMGKSSLGRSYEDIDLSGQMSQQYTYMASSNLGMTYNQYTALQSGNPLAASQARAGQNLALLSQIFSQDEVNWVKEKAQALGGQLDPNSALTIVPDFLRAFPNHNISVIQQQLAAFGIVQTDDPQKALAYAFNLIAGNNGDLASAQKMQQDTTVTSAANASKIQKKEGDSSPFFKSTDPFGGGNWITQGKAGAHYLTSIKGTGKRNPVIENLLQNVTDQDKAKVIVHTSNGQRVMSLDDAIKEHPEEISSGSVEFVSGKEKGKTVTDIVGSGGVNTSADWQSEASKSSGKTGTSLGSWQKDHPKDSTFGTGTGTGANGKVVVDLSDAAKQLLKISSATGIAGANGEGAPPVNSYNWNASR